MTCLASFVATHLAPRHKPNRTANLSASPNANVDQQTVADLRSALVYIDPGPRDVWVAIGHALKGLGHDGYVLFNEWSRRWPQFDLADADEKWATFNPSNTSYRAVFAKAQANGWQNTGQAKSYGAGLQPVNITNIQAHLQGLAKGTGQVGAAYKNGISAAALMAKDFAPIRNVIAGYVIEGLTLLAGAPKIGKSWMALGWGVSVASGTPAFGTIAVEQGDVLYLALEDNERRLKKRLRKMGVVAPDRLTLVTQWPDLDNGCVAEMEAWANDVARPIMIIVDVLNKVRPASSRSESQYEADYRTLSGLHAFASARNIAVVVVHHTRKMDAEDPFDTVSGSRGLTGAADTVLVLRRDGGNRNPMLYGRGRDIEEIENAMVFNPMIATWRVVGEAWNVAKTDERQEILDVLSAASSPMSPKDVAEQLGKSRSNINHLLTRMVDEGKASKVGAGLYSPVHSVHSLHSPHSERGEQSEWLSPSFAPENP